MMRFDQTELIESVTALLAADTELSEQIYKFEAGQPDEEGILTRLNGGQINVIDMGIKHDTDLWRSATIGLIVSTRRPSVNASDSLNTAIGNAVERVISENPKPGQFQTGVLGGLSKYECEALAPIEGSPTVRIRQIEITYKVFR